MSHKAKKTNSEEIQDPLHLLTLKILYLGEIGDCIVKHDIVNFDRLIDSLSINEVVKIFNKGFYQTYIESCLRNNWMYGAEKIINIVKNYDLSHEGIFDPSTGLTALQTLINRTENNFLAYISVVVSKNNYDFFVMMYENGFFTNTIIANSSIFNVLYLTARCSPRILKYCLTRKQLLPLFRDKIREFFNIMFDNINITSDDFIFFLSKMQGFNVNKRLYNSSDDILLFIILQHELNNKKIDSNTLHNRNYEFVKYLLDKGSNKNFISKKHGTNSILTLCLKIGRLDYIHLLLDGKVDSKIYTKNTNHSETKFFDEPIKINLYIPGLFVLNTATDINILKLLIEKGLKLIIPGAPYQPLLECVNMKFEMAKYIIDQIDDVNKIYDGVISSFGHRICIIVSIPVDFDQIIVYLLEKGMDLTQKVDGISLLRIAQETPDKDYGNRYNRIININKKIAKERSRKMIQEKSASAFLESFNPVENILQVGNPVHRIGLDYDGKWKFFISKQEYKMLLNEHKKSYNGELVNPSVEFMNRFK